MRQNHIDCPKTPCMNGAWKPSTVATKLIHEQDPVKQKRHRPASRIGLLRRFSLAIFCFLQSQIWVQVAQNGIPIDNVITRIHLQYSGSVNSLGRGALIGILFLFRLELVARHLLFAIRRLPYTQTSAFISPCSLLSVPPPLPSARSCSQHLMHPFLQVGRMDGTREVWATLYVFVLSGEE